MTVLVMQLAALLLAAAAIGLLVGWQLQRQRAAAQLSALNAQANRVCREERERAEAAIAQAESATRELGSIKVDHKQASRRLRNLTGALGDSESTIAGLEADVAALQEKLEAIHAGHKSELQQVRLVAYSEQSESDSHAAELAAAISQLGALKATLAERDSALQSLKTLIDTRDATINQMRERLASLEQSAANTSQAADRAAEEGDRLTAELETARQAAADQAAAARQAQVQLQTSENAANQTIAHLRAELERPRPEAASVQAEFAAMRKRLEGASITEQQLRAELSAAQMRELELNERYRLLAAKADSDDLKRIKGIGPVLEKSLKEQGITQFSQIAALNAEEIETISAILQTFPDRIRRDRWVEQAEQLARANHESA